MRVNWRNDQNSIILMRKVEKLHIKYVKMKFSSAKWADLSLRMQKMPIFPAESFLMWSYDRMKQKVPFKNHSPKAGVFPITGKVFARFL